MSYLLSTGEEEEGGDSALLGVLLGVLGVVLLLGLAALVITFRTRSRPRSSTPTHSTRLPAGESSEVGGAALDHPDLLEGETHSAPSSNFRSNTEVTQAVSIVYCLL